MDPQYQPAYHFLANLEFKGANSYEESEPAFATIDKVCVALRCVWCRARGGGESRVWMEGF